MLTRNREQASKLNNHERQPECIYGAARRRYIAEPFLKGALGLKPEQNLHAKHLRAKLIECSLIRLSNFKGVRS